MARISEKLMDSVWRIVATRDVGQIRAMQKRHQKSQKTLTKFASWHLTELPEDAGGLGIYVFHVVVEAFSSLTPRPGKVRRPAIDRAWQLPADMLAEEARNVEPNAVQYMEDALAEEDDVILTESEQALCSRIVQTAILSLHDACEKRGSK